MKNRKYRRKWYRSYKNLYEYEKCNIKYIDRYGDPVYKRTIDYCVTDRYGDVVKVVARRYK